MENEHGGHRQRMRERFRAQGLNGFAPHEVLELMLQYAIPQKDVNPIAHRLLERFGNLHAVLDADVEDLAAVEGIGEYAAVLLHLFSEAAPVLERSRLEEKATLRTRRDAEEYCIRLCRALPQEHFYVICLNARMQVLQTVCIAVGSLSAVQGYPRKVAGAVLRSKADTVLLCHNHPAGSLSPSAEDMAVTRILGGLLNSMDITLADHIIVADGQASSLAESGLIRFE